MNEHHQYKTTQARRRARIIGRAPKPAPAPQECPMSATVARLAAASGRCTPLATQLAQAAGIVRRWS